ncbi:MAG TPA: hypothetical protein VH590_19280 [Ktedonobacterales bacterium]
MSEQHLGINPEHWLHYQRLRRDRAATRRRGYVLLAVAGGLLALTIFFISTALLWTAGAFLALLVLLGFTLLLASNGALAIKRGRRPISDDEIARRRQQERQQLFQFAQGRVSWRYWLTVGVQSIIGIILLAFAAQIAWSLLTSQSSPNLLDGIPGVVLLLAGGYNCYKAIRGARLLRRLARLSSQELAARLSLGEATEGE